MMSTRIPLPDLIDLCRILRHNLGAGLTIQRVMQQQASRGRRSYRAIAGRISEAIQGGSSLSRAFDNERDSFPVLFLAMVKLGETTGHMPEIFGELERYYDLELQLRRQFRSQTILPIIQFFGAVFILTGVIYLLGLIASLNPGVNAKPLLTIFGLSGAPAAFAFLGVVFGTIFGAWTVFAIFSRLGRQKAWLDRLLLRVPALGSCLSALVMSRFTLALHLTLDSGLSITKALRLSLEATGNAYFASRADGIVQMLKNGQPLHEALDASGLFNDEFMELVTSAETSGQVPELMRQQANYYHEETARQMKTLTTLAGFAVWVCVAAFIIWAIFRIASVYLNLFENLR